MLCLLTTPKDYKELRLYLIIYKSLIVHYLAAFTFAIYVIFNACRVVFNRLVSRKLLLYVFNSQAN